MGRHSKEEDRKFVWADADPLARCVIAAFSGRIGSNEGELNEAAFVASMSEAFLEVRAQKITDHLGRVGLRGAREIIIQELQKPNAVGMANTLVEACNGFAGNDPANGVYWADAEREVITHGKFEQASGMLEDMSSTAAQYFKA